MNSQSSIGSGGWGGGHQKCQTLGPDLALGLVPNAALPLSKNPRHHRRPWFVAAPHLREVGGVGEEPNCGRCTRACVSLFVPWLIFFTWEGRNACRLAIVRTTL